MAHSHRDRLAHIVKQFAELPEVRAIALAGSQATGLANNDSDFDVYVFTQAPLTNGQRLAMSRHLSSSTQWVDAWGPSIEWEDPLAGARIDAIFFEAAWLEDQLDKVLLRHEASLGYSTCFWHTLRVSQPLYDRADWLAGLQQRAFSAYPETLRQNILALNGSVLRGTQASYREQIAKALARNDWVSVNHRIAALLASIFDIVFALNRQTHPGEKRLLDHTSHSCAVLPDNFRALVLALVHPDDQDPAIILATVDALVAEITRLIKP